MGTISEKVGAWFKLSGIANAFRVLARYGTAMAMLLFAGTAFAAQPVTSMGGTAPIASAELQNAATTLKIKSFSAQGTGLQGNGFTGTCFGEVCNASLGDCECDVFNGAVKAPILGQSTWMVSYTINDDDATETGNGGLCLLGEGELVISSAKGTIAAEVSGPECENRLGGSTSVFQYGQAFKIDPTLSTGSTAGLNGGGSFSLSDDLLSNFATMTANGFSVK